MANVYQKVYILSLVRREMTPNLAPSPIPIREGHGLVNKMISFVGMTTYASECVSGCNGLAKGQSEGELNILIHVQRACHSSVCLTISDPLLTD